MDNLVHAVLTTDISYIKEGFDMYVPKGFRFLLDKEKNIGLFGPNHVFLFEGEYNVLPAN